MRRAFWGIVFVLIITALGGTLPTPLYVLYQKRFHFSEIELTFIYAVYICGSIGGLLFFGRLSDQIGRRPVLWSAIIVAALSTVTYLFIFTEALLFIARILSGLAVAVALSTATAFLAELEVHGDKHRATTAALVANMLGLGTGPLLTGMLVQYEFLPEHLVFYVYLGMLAGALLAITLARETIQKKAAPVSFRPRVGIPEEKRAAFVSPAATGFCIFAVLGLFSALAPTLLSRQLQQTSHALAGAVVFEIYGIGAFTAFCFRGLSSQKAMFGGLSAIFIHLALLLVAMRLRSLTVLLIATAVGGVAIGLGFKGSLELINLLAPAGQRSEMLSNYYLLTYLGLALPAIGVGIISELVNPFVANLTFAAVVAALAVVGLVMGIRFGPQKQSEQQER